jgi:DNA-binding response OmpR family regulator
MNVLLVEPDILWAQLLEPYLTAQGHRVVAARTAQQAVAAADTVRPDIVFLEPLMAQHNGIEFLYEFRSYSEWYHIPVILLTRHATVFDYTYDMMRAELGIKHIIPKQSLSLRTEVLTLIKQYDSCVGGGPVTCQAAAA